MTKNYYRKEYSEQQWIALIDKAIEFGCKIEYSKYGNIAEINRLIWKLLLLKILQIVSAKQEIFGLMKFTE